MSTEQNKALVRRWFEEVLNKGNTDTVDVICMRCAPSFVVIQGVANPAPPGLEGGKEIIRTLLAAFPDLHFTVGDQIAEGDMVVSRLTVHGTHQGEFMGIPPTNKQMEIAGISIWNVQDDKLIQEWVSWDSLGMLQQLGIAPAQS